MIKKVLIAVLVCSFSSGLFAEDKDGPKKLELPYFSVGLGAVMSDSYYKDEDNRIIPIPNIVYMSEDYYFKGLTAGKWLLGDREGFKLAAQIGGRLEYIDKDESDYYDGMDPRRPTLEAGIKAEYSFKNKINLSFDAMTDVMSEHDGYELTAGLSRNFPALFGNQKLMLGLNTALKWRSENLNDHYFGVRSYEANPGRPEYQADAGLNYQIGASLNYQIDDKWSWFNRVGVEFLSDEIQDSPLVEDDYSISIFTGISYKI